MAKIEERECGGMMRIASEEQVHNMEKHGRLASLNMFTTAGELFVIEHRNSYTQSELCMHVNTYHRAKYHRASTCSRPQIITGDKLTSRYQASRFENNHPRLILSHDGVKILRTLNHPRFYPTIEKSTA